MIHKYVTSMFILNCFLLFVNGSCSGSKSIVCYNMTRQALIIELRYYSNYFRESLIIRNSNLYKINKELIPYVRNLTFDNCGITTIEKNSLQQMNHYLGSLILTGNNLTQFDTEVFPKFYYLNHLDVSNNNIKELKINCLYLQELTELILDNNPLETLTNDNFTSCSQLNTLKMQNCNIKQMHIEFQQIFPNLQSLHLTNNYLKKIQINSQLQTLDVSSNSLTEFNFTATQMISLDISDNKLSKLSANAFKGFNKLQTLNLSSLGITEIEVEAFSGMKSMINLNLELNNISRLQTKTFLGMNNLKKLNLFNSGIKEIAPNTFKDFQQLISLDISYNNLSKLEKYVFANLSSLKTLNLSNNEITEITCELFPKNNVLEDLDFSFNYLNGIQICAFEKLHKLLNLCLQNNSLQILRIGTFSGVANLKYLDLSHNELSFVDEIVLHPLEMIETIDISANKFVALDPVALLQHLLHLKQIDLSGNDWDCFNLTLVRKYLRHRGITYTAKIQNYSQENIGGIQCSSNNNDQHATTSQNEITIDRNGNATNEALFKILVGQKNLTNIVGNVINNSEIKNIENYLGKLLSEIGKINENYSQKMLNENEANNKEKYLQKILNEMETNNKETKIKENYLQKIFNGIETNNKENYLQKIFNEIKQTNDEKSHFNENYPQKQLSETEIKNNEDRRFHNILIIFITLCICYVLGKLFYKYYTTKNSKSKLKKTSNTSQCEIELTNEFTDQEQSTTNT